MLVSLGLRQAPPTLSALQAAPAVQAQPDASSILAALSRLQPMPAPAAPAPPPAPPVMPVQAPAQAPPTDLAAIMAGASRGYGQPPQAPPTSYGYPAPPPHQSYGQYQPPTPVAAMPPSYPPQYHTPAPYQQAPPQPPASAAPGSFLPAHILSNPQILPNVLQLIQGLSQEGIPQEQWGAVLSALYPPPQQGPPAQDAYPPRIEDRVHYRDRSRDRGDRNRSRSPEPLRNNNNNNNAGRRASPVYGTYDASLAQSAQDHASNSDRRGGRGRGRGGRNDYRQRTPPSAHTPQADESLAPRSINPKWTDMDNTIPPGHIKVLSRTLFVGGANGNEAELRAIFGRYGPVQTCIANEDKRHAFVKMCNRQDAVAAKTAMETTRDPDVLAKARQTKWGVGFGPRECCDYSNGVSVIPIDTLTEADHKWMLSAEYGGTGGRPIESGLVVEEPDIEIGAGVSSKAMSRRVGPDGGSNRGGGGGGRRGGRGGGGGGGRFGQSESHHSHRPEPVTIAPPPPVPGFGFVPQFR
jgi:protein NRD1